jgi:hypothetical protein
MPTPRRPTATKVTTKMAATASTPTGLPARLAVAAKRKNATWPPTMNISLWAKLIRRSTP